jgi:hypothetical protein
MMLNAWLRTVLELTPKRLTTPVLSRPGQQPQDLGLTFGELGKLAEGSEDRVEHQRGDRCSESCDRR